MAEHRRRGNLLRFRLVVRLYGLCDGQIVCRRLIEGIAFINIKSGSEFCGRTEAAVKGCCGDGILKAAEEIILLGQLALPELIRRNRARRGENDLARCILRSDRGQLVHDLILRADCIAFIDQKRQHLLCCHVRRQGVQRLNLGADRLSNAVDDRHCGVAGDDLLIADDDQRDLCIRNADNTRKSLPDLLGIILRSAEQFGDFHMNQSLSM